MKELQHKLPQNIDADVCIVGCGGGGLAAAVGALESGAKKVIILEKTPRTGGTTRLPGGLFAVGTRLQKEQGLEYSPDECFVHHMDATNWTCNGKLVHEWYNATSENIDWLSEKGVCFERLVAFSGYTKSHHMTADKRTGNAIVEALLNECLENDVDIYMETRGKKLIVNNSGAVTGIVAESSDGSLCNIHAASVVLATGSISYNKELIARFYPGEDMSNVKIMANIPHNTGDGLLMAEEIGGGSSYVSTLFIGPQNHDSNLHISLLVRRPQVIKTNRNGERFADEGMPLTRDWGWYFSMAVDRQPGKVVYGLMDQSILDDMLAHPENMTYNEEFQGNMHIHDSTTALQKGIVSNFNTDGLTRWVSALPDSLREEVDKGTAKICASLAEAAEWIGADPAVLTKTIEDYNEYCTNGYDRDFLKASQYLKPLQTPPYYVMKSFSGIDTCIGGLNIDHHLRVMNKDTRPIPGLYAAGVIASGWLGRGYGYFGSECSFTVYSGRQAGINATRYAENIG